MATPRSRPSSCAQVAVVEPADDHRRDAELFRAHQRGVRDVGAADDDLAAVRVGEHAGIERLIG